MTEGVDSAAGWIALGAAVAAGLALLLALAFYLKLRRVRKAQVVLLGTGKDDLVDFAVSLQTRMDDLHRAVDEIAAGLARLDKRIDGCLSHTSIVRYDAYEVAGAPAGYVALEEDGPLVRVEQLFVSSEHEDEDVGAQLVDYAEGYAISR